jgi:hypothetical protein
VSTMLCRWRRHASATAVSALLAGVLCLAVCSTAAQAAPLCVVHGHSVRGVRTSKIIKLTPELVIYRTTLKAEEYGPKFSDVWACSRKSRRFVLIAAEEFNIEYGTEGALSEFQVAGTWLTVRQETGQPAIAECEKYGGFENQSCPSTSESLYVVNIASGLEGSVTAANLPAGSTLLSATGAMAWWSQTQGKEKEVSSSLYGCATTATKHKLLCKPRLLAQGAIPDSSVSLTGNTLSWSIAGAPQSSVL